MAAILYGADGLGDAAFYESPSGGAGNALAFWGTLVFTPKSTATSATRVLLSAVQPTPNRGWDIRTAGANASASMILTDSLNTGRASGVGTLGANVAGKICVWSFAWDGVSNKLYTWLNRAVAGSATGAAITGYTPSADGIVRIGSARHATATPGSDLAAYGFVLGDGLPTFAQFQAQHDAIMAADGRVTAIAGMSTMLVDLTLDARANGGVLPATAQDRIGSNHMTRTGSPATSPQYSRAFGW